MRYDCVCAVPRIAIWRLGYVCRAIWFLLEIFCNSSCVKAIRRTSWAKCVIIIQIHIYEKEMSFKLFKWTRLASYRFVISSFRRNLHGRPAPFVASAIMRQKGDSDSSLSIRIDVCVTSMTLKITFELWHNRITSRSSKVRPERKQRMLHQIWHGQRLEFSFLVTWWIDTITKRNNSRARVCMGAVWADEPAVTSHSKHFENHSVRRCAGALNVIYTIFAVAIHFNRCRSRWW